MNLPSITSRLPGGQRFKNLFKFMGVKAAENNELEKVLMQRKKVIFNEYFFGYKKSNSMNDEYYRNIYNVFCELYTDTEREDFFDFNGIKIFKPVSEEDNIIFIKEAIDILFCDLPLNKKLYDAVINEGPYEINNVNVSEGDIVIDCGANMGLFSATASKKGGIVYAFEPCDYIIETYLSKTAEYNPNINICKYALFDKKEQLEFACFKENMGANYLIDIKKRTEYSNKIVQTVQAITLDEFVGENNILKVDFIKADIEGAERNMLTGAKRVLKEFTPKLSICTYHLPDDPKIIRKIILEANPDYIIEERYSKLYAYVKKD